MRCQRCGETYIESDQDRICPRCHLNRNPACWCCSQRVGRDQRGNCLRCQAPEVDPRPMRGTPDRLNRSDFSRPPMFGGETQESMRMAREANARRQQRAHERMFGRPAMLPANLIILAIAQLSVNSPELEEQCEAVIQQFEALGNEFRDCSLLYVRYRAEAGTTEAESAKDRPTRRIKT
jgi:hypothetical protein